MSFCCFRFGVCIATRAGRLLLAAVSVFPVEVVDVDPLLTSPSCPLKSDVGRSARL